MKTIGKLILAIAVIVPLMVGGLSVRAASEEEIEASIEDGLAWLATQQAPDGSWGDPGWTAEGATGLAVLKFEERARELGFDPFDPAYEYSAQVDAGLNYLFSRTQEAGGLVWITTPLGWNDNYNTGIGMMALAASASPGRIVTAPGPVMNWTYGAVLQGMLAWMEDAQGDGGCEEGGWGYAANGGSPDQSNTGYSTLGIGYAISPVYGFGLTVDPDVLTKLEMFIDNVQRPDGGSDYNPCSPWDESNMLRTGNLLYEMALIGRPVDDPTVQAAIGYIENNWPAEMGDTQTRFTVMKGLEAYQIDTLTVSGMEIDWFDEVSTWIVDEQNPNGSWPGGWLHLDTAWNLLTLEKVVAPVNQPPECGDAAPSIEEIWPPNHKMVDVNILGVTDPDEDPVSIVITGITQDEPVNGLGDGNTSPDGAGVGTDTAQVRAERAGTPKVPGDGRVYHIHFEASDDMGGVCSGVVNVGVPHDQRPGHVIVDGGELYDSTVP